ncbi:MAG: hypothetical protein RLY72_92 [Planctomycetota bacterium]
MHGVEVLGGGATSASCDLIEQYAPNDRNRQTAHPALEGIHALHDYDRVHAPRSATQNLLRQREHDGASTLAYEHGLKSMDTRAH